MFSYPQPITHDTVGRLNSRYDPTARPITDVRHPVSTPKFSHRDNGIIIRLRLHNPSSLRLCTVIAFLRVLWSHQNWTFFHLTTGRLIVVYFVMILFPLLMFVVFFPMFVTVLLSLPLLLAALEDEDESAPPPCCVTVSPLFPSPRPTL